MILGVYPSNSFYNAMCELRYGTFNWHTSADYMVLSSKSARNTVWPRFPFDSPEIPEIPELMRTIPNSCAIPVKADFMQCVGIAGDKSTSMYARIKYEYISSRTQDSFSKFDVTNFYTVQDSDDMEEYYNVTGSLSEERCGNIIQIWDIYGTG